MPEKPNGLSVVSGVLVHLHLPDDVKHGYVSMTPDVARQVAFDLLSAAHRTELLHEPTPE